VCLGEAQGTKSGEKMIVWRQDGRTCRRGCTQSSRERGVDAVLAATPPAEDRDSGLKRSPPDVVPGAQPKRTTTGVADPTALRRYENCLKCKTHHCGHGLTLTDSEGIKKG
jgi:hypothetical protein